MDYADPPIADPPIAEPPRFKDPVMVVCGHLTEVRKSIDRVLFMLFLIAVVLVVALI